MNSQFLSALVEPRAGETFCALTDGVRNKDAAINSAATRILTYTRRVMPRCNDEKTYKGHVDSYKFWTFLQIFHYRMNIFSKNNNYYKLINNMRKLFPINPNNEKFEFFKCKGERFFKKINRT